MNVLIVSQCDKRALVETRRILDQFAERIGHRTWQTPITKAGLATLRAALRRTARRNTAVACHWIRGKNHSELLWIVGSAARFSATGRVPTNTTERDVLRTQSENTWTTGYAVRLISTLAALFHDFGKASRAFQRKLRGSAPAADAYRHEWVSLRLFEAFVCGLDDHGWLTRLATLQPGDKSWLSNLLRDSEPRTTHGPFSHLPSLASLVGWLIVSHHRLPTSTTSMPRPGLKRLPLAIQASWCGLREDANAQERDDCWVFDHGLPVDSVAWCRRASAVAQAVIAHPGLIDHAGQLAGDLYVAHLSRLTLMLADHHYSSLPADPSRGDVSHPNFANTDRRTGGLKQRLDEHLIGVAHHARRIAGTLPRLQHQLPRIARHRVLQRRTNIARYRWQNQAYDLAIAVRDRARQEGFFGVNMASTGCGKTLANGRIMYGLADPEVGARFSIALGLRTLTLQTGAVYREKLDLGEDELAVLVGGGAVKQLHELATNSKAAAQPQAPTAWEQCGSESAEELLGDDSHVHFEASLEDGPLREWLARDSRVAKMVSAPILTCTVDHLIPATEGIRGGQQIAPMLRLLTSDLVLDEPDDFDMDDLPALTRLVHWAGLLGSKLVLSSATLPPGLVQALFEAYLSGRTTYEQNRGVSGRTPAVCCAWFDEYGCRTSNHGSSLEFSEAYRAFAAMRAARVDGEPRRRTAAIVGHWDPLPKPEDLAPKLAQFFLEQAGQLHDVHATTDPASRSKVSFGLIRMANIGTLTDIAGHLFHLSPPRGQRVHLCVYHSRYPLVVRAAIEHTLDTALARHDEGAIFSLPFVQRALSEHPEDEHIFIVLASPVAEVGRDHDYDWAIVEPSSMRSIIQLAGRIRRHRMETVEAPNLLLLARNYRSLQGRSPAFCKPGFETQGHFLLTSQSLHELLSPEQQKAIHSGPRIVERGTLEPATNLVDLEHARMHDLLNPMGGGYSVSDWWTTPASLTGTLQRAQRFRAGQPTETFALFPDDETDTLTFKLLDTKSGEWSTQNRRLVPQRAAPVSSQISTWGNVGLLEALTRLQDQLGGDLNTLAARFATVRLDPKVIRWSYSHVYGFQQCRD